MSETAGTRSNEDRVMPIRHFDSGATIGSVLDDSRFQALKREGVEIREDGGRLRRAWHFGVKCYELIITIKEGAEDLLARLVDVLASHGFWIIEDAETANAAVRKSKPKNHSSSRGTRYKEGFAAG